MERFFPDFGAFVLVAWVMKFELQFRLVVYFVKKNTHAKSREMAFRDRTKLGNWRFPYLQNFQIADKILQF